MVKHFSGKGTAKLTKKDLLEMQNPFNQYKAFTPLYEERQQHRALCYGNRKMHLDTNSGPVSSEPDGIQFVPNDVNQYTTPNQGLLGSNPSSMGNIPPSTSSLSRTSISGPRLHWGPNVKSHTDDYTNSIHPQLETDTSVGSTAVRHSSIFLCILSCVALPLILCMIGISTYVVLTVSWTLPTLVKDLEEGYTLLQRSFHRDFAQTEAETISHILYLQLRDLYLYNRLAGWLMLGAVQQANTFTTMATGAEKCKVFAPEQTCPNVPPPTCSCGWNDPFETSCESIDSFKSRQSQTQYFEGLREDVDPITGNRNSTSYPQYGSLPGETLFWDGINSLPGSDSQYETKGVDDSFARLRAASALSVVQFPLYNYVQGHNLPRAWSTAISFEADGMVAGYSGCSDDHIYAGHEQITDDNEAWTISDLCPEGKYGLDSRCLAPYAEAKKASEDAGSVHPVHFHIPTDTTETKERPKAIMPVVNPMNGNIVAQTQIEFSLQEVWDLLDDFEWGEGVFQLVALAGNDSINEVVNLLDNPIEPDQPIPEDVPTSKMTIEEAIMPLDKCDDIFGYDDSCRHLDSFASKRRVATGQPGYGWKQQLRTDSTGGVEVFNFNWSPSYISSVIPKNASDFATGVTEVETAQFLVISCQTEKGVMGTFRSVSTEIDATLRYAIIIITVGIGVAMLAVLYISTLVARSVSIPIAQLCTVVASMNQSDLQDEIPRWDTVSSSSYEVLQVRATFERLHMLLRDANSMLFSGQLDNAYETMRDALGLFSKLENTKAMGVANNNLGVVALTIYRTIQKTAAPTLCGMTNRNVIRKGAHYFQRAIDIGEEAIERTNQEEGFSEDYLVFMQQLSNRYFNRAMFLLSARKDHPNPNQAESQGLMDLQVARDMDQEVIDNGDREGFKGDLDVHLELLLGRIKGNLLLMKMGFDDEWGVDELIESARTTLMKALRDLPSGTDTLFCDLGPAGYMQRLDGALMEYYLHLATKAGKLRNEVNEGGDGGNGDGGGNGNCNDHSTTAVLQHPKDPPLLSKDVYIKKAALVAVRMMFEDEYVVGDAALLALRSLIEFTNIPEAADRVFGDSNDASDVRSSLFQYRQRITETIALSYEGRDLIKRESFLAANLGDVSMEEF